MPLTSWGEEIKKAMESQYGYKENKQAFYTSKNKSAAKNADKSAKHKDK
jgi:hypothetical protein